MDLMEYLYIFDDMLRLDLEKKIMPYYSQRSNVSRLSIRILDIAPKCKRKYSSILNIERALRVLTGTDARLCHCLISSSDTECSAISPQTCPLKTMLHTVRM